MRLAAASILSATLFSAATLCFSQSPCSDRAITPNSYDKPLTSTELVHRIMLTTSSEDLHNLAFGDVEYILKCGTQQDAESLFAAIGNTSVKMVGATVVEANQNSIRVAWDDGFKPHLGTFWFDFEKPLTVIPMPGEKIIINGTYVSYTREPLQIVMTNPSFVLSPSPVK